MPNKILRGLLIIFIGLLIFELITHISVEILWFNSVGYLFTFIKRLLWQMGLWLGTAALSFWFLHKNLTLSRQWRWQQIPQPQPEKKSHRLRSRKLLRQPLSPQSQSLNLPILLGLVFSVSFLLSILLIYYTQVAIDVWTPDFTLPAITPQLPSPFSLKIFSTIITQVNEQLWKAGIVIVMILLAVFQADKFLKVVTFFFSLVLGVIIAGNWTRILLWLNPTSFEKIDPQFQNNVSFYIFTLPILKLFYFWFAGLLFLGLLIVSLTYLLSAKSLSQGKFPGFSRPQLRHLYTLGGLLMIAVGFHHWLARYQLLYSPRGVVYGASYTDLNVTLPINTALSFVSFAIAVWLLLKAITGRGKRQWLIAPKQQKLSQLPFSPFPLYIYLGLFLGSILIAQLTQYLIVQPNELARERPYIQRSIEFTRQGFNLEKITPQVLQASGQLSDQNLQENQLIVDNIRLWDSRPLLQANRQLQQIRLYYKFPDADYDRYTIKQDTNSSETTTYQVLTAARELAYEEVPDQAKTWVNKHLVYTHGYGFTLSPVNETQTGGLPAYFVKDIGTGNEEGNLETANEQIRVSIPISRPRIYYGELSNTYIMTHTKIKELDFPSGEDNVYNTYDGSGGIAIGTGLKRLMAAQYFKDPQLLATQNFTPETRLLFRRNINRRIREIAPFLRYDRDPYLVAAKGIERADNQFNGDLYWIVDAYTTSPYYPYSDPGERDFNYIRNSVKVVIDAYHGDVYFYVMNEDDPIIQSWKKIFPNLFHPFAKMPSTLKSHIRYPTDLFNTQSERLLTYHMEDTQVFYNREDQWRIPQEIYGGEQQPVEPYYLIMSFEENSAEFVLAHFYTPTSRNNLVAGLFARSDDQNYGKLLLYQLPKQKLIYGPEQIESLINQDPEISQQISLWNREGSKVIQGNLLVIPIENSLLYVEPIYLEAEQNSLPTLTRVVVAYENQIVMAETLKEALTAIFKTSPSQSETIIRSVEATSSTELLN
ncbi:MAG: UPF0182 family protein [Microcystaceae cyanobacterium]